MTGQLDWLNLPITRDHQRRDAALDRRRDRPVPTQMLLLHKAHLGEVSVSVWPKILKEICARKNIFVIE